MRLSSFFTVFSLLLLMIIPFSARAQQPMAMDDEQTPEDLQPPDELQKWLSYALKRYPPEDCPHLDEGVVRCAAVTAVSFAGDLGSGKLDFEVVGRNWGRTAQTLDLVGPSSAFFIESPEIVMTDLSDTPLDADKMHVAPYFNEAGGFWQVDVPPRSKFSLKASLTFSTGTVIPVTLPADVGRIRQQLTGGVIRFDPNVGSHGGEAQFVLAKDSQPESTDKPHIRILRVFNWGVIPTFDYRVTAYGLRQETAVQLALLGDEVIETVSPEKPYTVQETPEGRLLQTNLSPANHEITISGHYQAKPEQFKMKGDLPFEIWLQMSDNRYPVNVETDARPIDPTEFSSVVAVERARAFLVKPGQVFRFMPVELKVDEGRKASGSINYVFREGATGSWLERLSLTAKISQDRLVVPTPATPIYAGIGGDGIELHHDDKNQLSVRLPADGLTAQSLDVDWSLPRPLMTIAGVQTFDLPGQALFLDDLSARIQFRPGVVPLWAWGAETIKGDLRDEFHLYGLLIGILAFFILRGLKVSRVFAFAAGALLAGLYLDGDFPTGLTMLLLVATLPFVVLKDDAIFTLRKKMFLRRLILLTWSGIFLLTVLPLASYGRDQVFAALHPYAGSVTTNLQGIISDYAIGSIGGSSGEGYSQNIAEMKKSKAVLPPPSPKFDDMRSKMSPQQELNAPNLQNQQVDQLQYQKDGDAEAKIWNAKPVAITAESRVGREVQAWSNHLAEGQAVHVRVAVIGPVLRALWMLAEVGLILVLVLLMAKRSLRLWRREDQ